MTNIEESRPRAGRRRRWRERIKRGLRYRLVIPLKRSRHPPEYTARGVAVGIFWGLTPTVGVQMAVVLVHWWISAKCFRRDFNIVSAMAWTWITNVFTLLPFYYLFYVTGQLMLGRDDITGYRGFAKVLHSSGADDASFSELIQTWGAILLKDWFLAMSVGCLPYAAVGGWFAWRWSLAAVTAYRAARSRHADRKTSEMRDDAGPGHDSG